MKTEKEINELTKELQNNPFHKIIQEVESIKSYGLKSGKRLYTNYNQERKVQGRQNKVKEREMHFYANDNTFSKKNNEVPKEFENKIICGDSEEVLKQLPDNCIDLVFTSPPYNFGLDYGGHNDGVHWNKYIEKLFAIFKECIRVVKYGGRIIINVQPLYSDYIPIHHMITNFFIQNKMIWRNEILWEKNNYNCKYTAWGSWKSPSKPYLKYTWEFLEVFSKGDLKHEGKSENADITGDEFKAWVYAKWSIAPERKMKDYGHPAMFPENLADRTLKLYSFKGDIVLDPFNGAGTTPKIAKHTGRRYIGIDTSEEYCKKAEERLNEPFIPKQQKKVKKDIGKVKKGLIKDCTDCQTYGFGCAGDTLLKAREWKGWHGVLKNNKELILASSRKRNADFSKKCLGKDYKVIKVKVVEEK